MIDRNIASKAGFWFPGIVRNFQVALKDCKRDITLDIQYIM